MPVVTTATAGASLAGGNLQFQYAGGAPAAQVGVAGNFSNSSYVAAGDAIGTTKLVANLGTVSFDQHASGYDADTAAPTTYLLGKVGGNAMLMAATGEGVLVSSKR